MVNLRIGYSPKPTLCIYVYDKETRGRIIICRFKGWKADLILSSLADLLSEVRHYADGRRVLECQGEEQSLKIKLIISTLRGMRSKERCIKVINAIKSMNEPELHWWYRLYLKYDRKLLRALRILYAKE